MGSHCNIIHISHRPTAAVLRPPHMSFAPLVLVLLLLSSSLRQSTVQIATANELHARPPFALHNCCKSLRLAEVNLPLKTSQIA